MKQTRVNWEAKQNNSTENKFKEALERRDDCEKILENYRSDTAVLTIRTSLVIGIIISAAGFRILDTLFVTENIKGDFQSILFGMTDILLSAGVLAGGSAAIHELSSSLGQFFESSNKRNKKNATE